VRELRVTVRLEVNGTPVRAEIDARTMLAELLRNELGLLGTRIGCGEGQCGACTVLLDGLSARSCIVLAAQADGGAVTTVEGLAGETNDALDQLQRAFAAEHALQCGYCTAGMLIMAEELLRERPDADDDEIRRALAGNLCRCTGYQGIVRAVRRVRDERLAGSRIRYAPDDSAAGPSGRKT
jgi:carbon-monoxide dehydrogenase small subunit